MTVRNDRRLGFLALVEGEEAAPPEVGAPAKEGAEGPEAAEQAKESEPEEAETKTSAAEGEAEWQAAEAAAEEGEAEETEGGPAQGVEEEEAHQQEEAPVRGPAGEEGAPASEEVQAQAREQAAEAEAAEAEAEAEHKDAADSQDAVVEMGEEGGAREEVVVSVICTTCGITVPVPDEAPEFRCPDCNTINHAPPEEERGAAVAVAAAPGAEAACAACAGAQCAHTCGRTALMGQPRGRPMKTAAAGAGLASEAPVEVWLANFRKNGGE
jgi:hypothetical protein